MSITGMVMEHYIRIEISNDLVKQVNDEVLDQVMGEVDLKTRFRVKNEIGNLVYWDMVHGIRDEITKKGL